MQTESLSVKKFGPIENALIHFGDLTLFVGPNGTGKGLLLQLIKLLTDKSQIRRTLQQYGFVWDNTTNVIIDRYFGEGMSGIWDENTEINFDNKIYTKDFILTNDGNLGTSKETLFYIPAQRVVCLQNGWPRFFTDYGDYVPFVLRHFSETLRQSLENTTSEHNGVIFPQQTTLSAPLRDSFNNNIFHDGKITFDQSIKKRFKLNIGNSSIPYMAWSAGQKEFMPLLLSFYWLCPPSNPGRKDGVKCVIVEEPEMGLHPKAIESVILQIIDLLSRGYKVILSTHSPVLLEFAWAFHNLQKLKAEDSVLSDLFDLGKSDAVVKLFKGILKNKTINTYYFDSINNKVDIKDISTLDAGSEDQSVAEWGGLSSFSSKASDIISKIMAQSS